mmetsp:Transcript_3335/g.5824  ORF Transcript_3335/g.5824 Transcript_3335/m.5824 type:complete len:252 (+) Transcript_3335:2013-2768(+)
MPLHYTTISPRKSSLPVHNVIPPITNILIPHKEQLFLLLSLYLITWRSHIQWHYEMTVSVVHVLLPFAIIHSTIQVDVLPSSVFLVVEPFSVIPTPICIGNRPHSRPDVALPATRVVRAISKVEPPFPTLLPRYPVPCVHSSISIGVHAFPMLLVVLPLTRVHLSILEFHRATTMSHLASPSGGRSTLDRIRSLHLLQRVALSHGKHLIISHVSFFRKSHMRQQLIHQLLNLLYITLHRDCSFAGMVFREE